MNIRLRKFVACFSLAALYLISGESAIAQTNLTNVGRLIHIESNTVVSVTGNVDNISSGTIENNGTIKVGGNWSNQAAYTPMNGRIIMAGSAAQSFTSNTSQADQVYRLHINNPSNNVTIANSVEVIDTLRLINGKFITGTGAADHIYMGESSKFAQVSGTSFVEGPLNQKYPATGPTATKTLPIGRGVDYRPVTLNGVDGVSPVIRFEAFSGATGGTPGAGVYSLGTAHYWSGQLVAGTLTQFNNVEPQYTASDLPGAYIANGYVVASCSLQTGTYTSLGNGGDTGSDPYTTKSASAPPLALSHYFVMGRGQNLAGTVSAPNNIICYGDSNKLTILGYETGANLQWQKSVDAVSYVPIAGATNNTLNLKDTLSFTHYFRVAITGTNFQDAYSPVFQVTVNESMKLKVKVFLEGPYDPIGNQMRNDLYTSGILDRFEHDGVADTNMFSWASVPSDAVDLVKVEVWKDVNLDGMLMAPTDVKVDTAFAWLKQDGSVVRFFNGSSNYLNFCSANNVDDYFFVVRHRNHLAVASASTANMSKNIPSGVVDLTDVNNIYNYGATYLDNNGAGDIYGMVAGNIYDNFAFGDIGEVNAIDFNIAFYQYCICNIGYSVYDADLDGFANSSDYLKVSNNNDMLFRSEAPPGR